jgi:vitamin B12 transporter
MARGVIGRSGRQSAAVLFLVIAALLVPSISSHSQTPPVVSGFAVDELGAAIVGARVTVTDAAGAVVQTTQSDGAGGFLLAGLVPGHYVVVVEMPLFAAVTHSITVTTSGAAGAVRAVLKAGGFSDSVVVTARRVGTRLAETPQKIEVIDATDIERSVAADLTDVLKKNSGVDVVQYNGALSGVGIRGFRPQFSGINKRSLLLIDGRPSGVTNLATLLLDNVERIEVLKGATSAVYGSSAMGGVVNVITRQSRGRIGGTARIGAGSFGASEFAARVGGNVSSRLDIDVTGNAFDQRDDYRMGNGDVRPATSYKTYDGSVRLGVDLSPVWRIDGRANGYRGRDIMSPGDLFTGVNSQGSKNLERSTEDARLTGRIGGHELSFTGYGAKEASHTTNVTTSNPLDAPYLPYLSFENDLAWSGVQAKDSWQWSRLNSAVLGVDYERVTSVSRSYTRAGDRAAPFSADANKRTAGVYAENTLRLRNGRTVVAAGARLDRISNETLATPLKTNFMPSRSTSSVFNPSLGIKHELVRKVRGHFTIGRAFVPAEASMLTGFTTTIVSGRTQISQGNPDLKPERSTSFDAGAEWTPPTARFDVTLFRTVVKDRFISNVLVSNPPPPEPIIVSVKNGLDAHISGLDLELEKRLGQRFGLFANATHYFSRKERLSTGAEQDILNVAQNTIRAGVDVDLGRISTRLSGRYVQGRKDNDFNAPGFPIINYDNFTVVDASASYRLARQHSIVAAINNVFDAFYYEKLGYPLQGASIKLSYRLGF